MVWVHSPVYPEVYDMFRDFKYNPIDDARFALLQGASDVLTENEKKVIDLVVGTFGLYGGKVLEKITHSEEPWIEARKGYGEGIPSNEILQKDTEIDCIIEAKKEQFSVVDEYKKSLIFEYVTGKELVND